MTKQILALCTLAVAVAAAAAGTAFARHTGARDTTGTPRIPPASTFSPRVDNPWFPLKPGTRYRYTGVKDGKPSRDVVTVTQRTNTIEGVPCVAVHDQLYLGGRLEERTTDWYSQDSEGNVWYFGENTAELDKQGHVTNTSGTWRAGVRGAKPAAKPAAEKPAAKAGNGTATKPVAPAKANGDFSGGNQNDKEDNSDDGREHIFDCISHVSGRACATELPTSRPRHPP